MMRTNRYGNQFTRTPKFKPARDRRINVRAVVCPTCSAAPDGSHREVGEVFHIWSPAHV